MYSPEGHDRFASPPNRKAGRCAFSPRFSRAAIAALVVLATASAGVNTPQSGWYSGNPLLGPNALRDLACAGSTCYASGDFGTLLKSTDSGATWKGIVTGLTLDLPRVELAGGSPDHVDRRRRLRAQALRRRRPDVLAPAVHRPRPGLLGASGRVLVPDREHRLRPPVEWTLPRDRRRGRSFSRRTTLPGNANDLLCTGPQTCFTAGAGNIQRTDDGGVSWTQVADHHVHLRSPRLRRPAHALRGRAVQHALEEHRRRQTWHTSSLSGVPLRELTGISCGDELHCLMTTQDSPMVPGPLYRTVDGGVTATAVTPSTDPTFAVAFASPSRVIAAGGVGQRRSLERRRLDLELRRARGPRASFGTLTATAADIAYSGGAQGALVRTNDGGQTWANVSPPDRLGHHGPGRLGPVSALRPGRRRNAPAFRQRRRELQPAEPGHDCTCDGLSGPRPEPAPPGRWRGRALDGRRRDLRPRNRQDRPGAPERGGSRNGRRVRLRPRSIFKSTDHGAHWRALKTPKRQRDRRPRLRRPQHRLPPRHPRRALEDDERRLALEAASRRRARPSAWRSRTSSTATSPWGVRDNRGRARDEDDATAAAAGIHSS